MALLEDFLDKGAVKIKTLGSTVVISLRAKAIFLPMKADIDELDALTTALAATIIDPNLRNLTTNLAMDTARKNSIDKLKVVRKGAETICDGDEALEASTGFTPSKRTRTVRTSVDAAFILEANSTGIRNQVELILKEAVKGNQGYEVHYVVTDGDKQTDHIAGVFKTKGRAPNIKMLVTGLPSGKPIEIYLITLSTNGVRSTESNMKDAVAL